MTPQQIHQKTVEIIAYIATVPLEDRQQALHERLNADISDDYIRQTIFLVIAAQIQITREVVLKEMAIWEKITAAAGGFIFIVALLIIALVIPQPSDF